MNTKYKFWNRFQISFVLPTEGEIVGITTGDDVVGLTDGYDVVGVTEGDEVDGHDVVGVSDGNETDGDDDGAQQNQTSQKYSNTFIGKIFLKKYAWIFQIYNTSIIFCVWVWMIVNKFVVFIFELMIQFDS